MPDYRTLQLNLGMLGSAGLFGIEMTGIPGIIGISGMLGIPGSGIVGGVRIGVHALENSVVLENTH